jgi:His-Xaa-Ser system protein HxsD
VAAPVTVSFNKSVQSLEPLQEAAYRLIGVASCAITTDGDDFLCVLSPAPGIDHEAARARFLDLLTDENIRARVAARTEKVRDVILSLAFGAIAAGPSPSSGD